MSLKSRKEKRRLRRVRSRRNREAQRLGAVYCESCSKFAWPTFEKANERVESLKSQPGARKPELIDAYRCRAGAGWHIGHNYKLKWISLCIGEHK